METLLAAATREDELVTNLLRAFARNDRRGIQAAVTAIASNRGRFPVDSVSLEVETPMTGDYAVLRPTVYWDKLLVAIQREEILIESIVTASAKGERTKLFSLCRDLAQNRRQIDPDFRRANNFPEDLTP